MRTKRGFSLLTVATCANGTPYSAAIAVSPTTMSEAVAGLNGYAASKLVEAIYTILGEVK